MIRSLRYGCLCNTRLVVWQNTRQNQLNMVYSTYVRCPWIYVMVVIQLLSDYRHNLIGLFIHGQEEWRDECNTVVLDFTSDQCNASTGLQTSSVMYLFENSIRTTDIIFDRYLWSHLSRSRMADVPGLYLSAAARRQSRMIVNPASVSGKALSNSNDARTLSIAS